MNKPGRNDPCPCGSSKKYKQCCGAMQAAQSTQASVPPITSPSVMSTLQAAVGQHQAGNLQQAEGLYRRVLQAVPNHPDALHYLGVIGLQLGNHAVAIEYIGKAIDAAPSSTMHSNLAIALQAQGKYDAAVEHYLKAIALEPGFDEAHFNLGTVLQAQGKLDAAYDSYQQALSLTPQYAAAHANLGNLLKDQRQPDAAIASYRRALSIRSNDAETCGNLATLLQAQGHLDAAADSYRHALALKPDSATAHFNFGTLLQAQGTLDAAAESYQRAAAIKPDFTDAHINLAMVFLAQGKRSAALASIAQAQALEPLRLEWQLRGLGAYLPSLLDSADQAHLLRTGLAQEVERLRTHAGTVTQLESAAFNLFSMAYHGAADRDLMEKISGMVRLKVPALDKVLISPTTSPSPQSSDSRFRIGFVSSLLCDHTMGKLTQGTIRHLDRKRFHVSVIHAPGGKNDGAREAINAMADTVLHLSPQMETAQQQVADLALDVLHYPDVGMSTYTYFLAYARLAPVQSVSWGHPVTTGLSSMDYFLSFAAAEPEGAEDAYTETLVRLQRAPAYYELAAAPLKQPASRAEMGLPEHGTLYGCLQTLFKFHPDFDAVLAEIVERDPQAWIVAIEGNKPHLREQLRQRWSLPYPKLLERVIFLPQQPLEQFLMLVAQMDVLLDTPHFGSGNTLYESLAQGVPTITWPGAFMRGRLVAGMYRWLGIEDAPIAARLADYASLAVAVATDHTRRAALTRELKQKAGAMYSDELAVRELEAFFEQAVFASRRGEKLQDWASDFFAPANPNQASYQASYQA